MPNTGVIRGCSNEVRGVFGVELCKSIPKGWGDFVNHFRLVIGDGFWIRFWHDIWFGDMALKNEIPSLSFRIVRDQNAYVADYLDNSYGPLHWNVRFIGPAQDWEVGDTSNFSKMLYVLNIGSGKEDRLLWTQAREQEVRSQIFI